MPKRVFFDWAAPLLPAFSDQLLPAAGKGTLDLGSLWLIAPTRQAGRRLREHLAHEWKHRGGTGLLSLEVHPPTFLLQPADNEPVAGPFDLFEAWQSVLESLDPEDCPALLPGGGGTIKDSSALDFGQRLQLLREEVLDAGLDLTAVAESPFLESEKQRWRDLAALEKSLRAQLAARGLKDPCDAKRERIQSYEPPPGVSRLILAAVPDPSPLLLRRLQELDASHPVEIEVWIHAPASEADAFDDWGRPKAEWRERHLGRGDEPEGWIELLADPSRADTRMRELLADAPAAPDLALGVLDDSLLAPLRDGIEAAGGKLYDPSPVPLSRSPAARLLSILHEQRTRNDPASLRRLWRCPELLRALAPENPSGLLADWEQFAEHSFPDSDTGLDERLPEGSLREAWQTLSDWIAADRPRTMLEVLRETHRGRDLRPEVPEDRYTLRQLEALADSLQEAARREEAGRAPSAALVLKVLERESVDPLRVEGTLTAEGWLELSYHPASSVLLAGFQEGRVPSVQHPDPFLPNGLRESLGLRGDRDWLARDAYLFHCLCRSRAPGAVRVWVFKRDPEGNPLLPSRLLFACPDDEMLRRAGNLFREAPPGPPVPPPAEGLPLRVDPAWERPVESLSVSDIAAYLRCPARFYFQKVLGLRRGGDDESEPDAAVFGELIHAVLERVVREPVGGMAEWDARCRDQLEQLLHSRFGSLDRMSLQIIQHSARSRLHAAGAVQLGLWEEGWQTAAFETRLVRPCRGLDIRGIIDRIDRHPDGRVRIIDYKTSDTAEPPKKTHLGPAREGREEIHVEVNGKVRQWTNLQLPLYRWLGETSGLYDPNAPLEVMYFNLPKSVDKTGLGGWPEEEALQTEVAQCLNRVVECIQQRKWHPAQAPGRFDDFTPLLHHGADWVPTPDPS